MPDPITIQKQPANSAVHMFGTISVHRGEDFERQMDDLRTIIELLFEHAELADGELNITTGTGLTEPEVADMAHAIKKIKGERCYCYWCGPCDECRQELTNALNAARSSSSPIAVPAMARCSLCGLETTHPGHRA